ncbi:type II toxin-antitoxin system RelB/DinJ family antitoxin [Candidatus Peregrinibacteria bacterium]|nr:type II toxin-antitoxin system RelB/DinJ family antitoxin [Candidatus Peregrinibacteria bacterium]
MTKAIQIRVDQKLKEDVDLIFEDLGLDTPTAIRLFLKKVVASKSIPFELKSTRTDNGFTEEFEEEVLKASTEKDQIGPFKSANDAITELHKKSK